MDLSGQFSVRANSQHVNDDFFDHYFELGLNMLIQLMRF